MEAWKPRIDPDMLARRADALMRIRNFFRERGVTEVTTPVITASGITDPNIDSVSLNDDNGYLRTSPEYFHKRLLTAGFGDIYELGPVFRAREHGRHHRPEFWLLEWYRTGWGWRELTEEVVELIQACSLPEARPLGPPVYRTWLDCMQEVMPACPIDCSDSDLQQLTPSLPTDCDRDMRLDFLFATAVQPAFPADRLTVVHAYPASQAALARLDPDDPRFAERFEVFGGPMELANGYRELTSAREQRQRFERDNRRRRELGRPVMPIDEQLLEALTTGMPECSGVALGLERLLMILHSKDDIGQVMPF